MTSSDAGGGGQEQQGSARRQAAHAPLRHTPMAACRARRSSARGPSAPRSRGGSRARAWTSRSSTSSSPATARATSGGETRLIRCGHGEDAVYTASARRARTLWRELEAESGADLMIECGLAWFAHRDDGWEAASEAHHARPGHPGRAARRRGGRAAVPELPRRRPRVRAATSRRPACCARSGRCRRSPRRRSAHGAKLVRGRARAGRRATRCSRTATRARGRPRRLGLRRLAAGISSPDSSSVTTSRARTSSSSTAAPRGARARAGSTTTARSTAPATSTSSASRRAPDSEGPPLDPDDDAARHRPGRASAGCATTSPGRFPALAEAAPLKCSTTCRYELSPDSHFIAARAPRARERVDRARRRLRPRLQARPGDGRADRGGLGGRAAPAARVGAGEAARRALAAHRGRRPNAPA